MISAKIFTAIWFLRTQFCIKTSILQLWFGAFLGFFVLLLGWASHKTFFVKFFSKGNLFWRSQINRFRFLRWYANIILECYLVLSVSFIFRIICLISSLNEKKNFVNFYLKKIVCTYWDFLVAIVDINFSANAYSSASLLMWQGHSSSSTPFILTDIFS